MKYQKMEEKRKQETDTVFSWSENAFLSSDEGVSTISASGETDDLRKPEGKTKFHANYFHFMKYLVSLYSMMWYTC